MLLGSTWNVRFRNRLIFTTDQFSHAYELVLDDGGYPRRVMLTLVLDRFDLFKITQWKPLLEETIIPPDPTYQLLSAVIEAGSDPTLRCLTPNAARKISALVCDRLNQDRVRDQEAGRGLRSRV